MYLSTYWNFQETAVYPQPTYAPQGNQAAAYGAPIMYAPPTPVFMPAQQYQYSPMPVSVNHTLI